MCSHGAEYHQRQRGRVRDHDRLRLDSCPCETIPHWQGNPRRFDRLRRHGREGPPEKRGRLLLAEALKRATQSRSVTAAGGPKWIVLTDAEADSYDFSAKVTRVEKGAKRIAVQFQADQKAIAGKQHYLFAAWAASERYPCERKSKYSRSGCQHEQLRDRGRLRRAADRSLSGDGNQRLHQNGDEWTAERWIVERFR